MIPSDYSTEDLNAMSNVYSDIKKMIFSKNQRVFFVIGLAMYVFLGFLFYDAQPVQRPDINVFHIVHFWQGVVTGIVFSNVYLVALFNLVHELLEFQTSNETPIDKILDPIVFFIGYLISNKLFFRKIFTRLKNDLQTYLNKKSMFVFTFDLIFGLIMWVIIELALVFGGIFRSVFNQEPLPINQIVDTILIFTNIYTFFAIIIAIFIILTPLIISNYVLKKPFYSISDLFEQYRHE